MLVASCEFLSAFFLITILLGLQAPSVLEKEKSLHFRRAVIWLLIATIVDALSYALEYSTISLIALFIIKALSIITIDIVIPFLAAYMFEELNERCHMEKSLIYVIFILCVIDLIVTLMGSFTGWMFTIADGHFRFGPLYKYIRVIPFICLLYVVGVVLVKSRKIGRELTIILIALVLIPLVALIIRFIKPEIPLMLVALSISVNLAYITILSNEVVEVRTKASMIPEVSVLDNLTGLKNHNAFQISIPKLLEEKFIGHVCCDVNALKRINDEKGVEAGDAVLLELVSILKHSFDPQTIYRIGDDNFAAIVLDASEEDFNNLVNAFRRKIMMTNNIAAVGSCYGPGNQLYKIISESEDMMRADKLGFRRNTMHF